MTQTVKDAIAAREKESRAARKKAEADKKAADRAAVKESREIVSAAKEAEAG